MHSMVRIPLFLGLSLGLISACTPQVPDSGASYNADYQAREAELAGGAASAERLAPPQPLSSQTLDPAGTAVPPQQSPGSVAAAGSPEGIAEQTAAVLASSSTGATYAQTPVVTTSGLSAENDFSAVSENRSIQSDAALIAGNRAQYQEIAPTALPKRSGTSQPNIVAYALSTSHPKGTRIYSRSGINLQGRADRACRSYASSDLAQIEFLSRGGPEQDRSGLDPDGDGYACSWDPAPFRKVQGG